MRGVSSGSEVVSQALLLGAATTSAGLQFQVAAPLAAGSGITGAVSFVSGGLADLLEADFSSGLETTESVAPLLLGTITEGTLKALKVPSTVAKSAGIYVEGIATIAENVDDIVQEGVQ